MSHDPGRWRFFAYLNLFMFSMLLLVLADGYLVLFGGLGARRPVELPADRLLVQAARAGARLEEGLPRQPRRRPGLPHRHHRRLPPHRHPQHPGLVRAVRRGRPARPQHRGPAALRRVPRARARSSRSTSGCPTRWRARRRCRRSSTRRRWSTRASTSSRARRRSSPRRPRRSSSSPSIGIFTAILAASIALTQNDIKRVLAYSTLSQLGYMFAALGRGRLRGRDLPPHGPWLHEGPAVPRLGLGHPRRRRRAGHAAHGRAVARASPSRTGRS